MSKAKIAPDNRSGPIVEAATCVDVASAIITPRSRAPIYFGDNIIIMEVEE